MKKLIDRLEELQKLENELKLAQSNLFGNKIDYIEEKAFEDLSILRGLSLDKNKLKWLNPN